MAGIKATFQKFSSKMDLLVLVVIGVFVLMVRPVREIQDISYQGRFLYLAVGTQGVRVLDRISNTSHPIEVGGYNTFGTANALDLSRFGDQSFLYVADGKAGLAAFEVGADGQLTFLWSDKNLSRAQDIAVTGKFALVARGKKGLSVARVDRGVPGDSGEIWGVNGLPDARMVVVESNRAYVVDGSWQLHVLNINQPQNAELLQTFPVGVPVNDLIVNGGVAYLATESNGLILLNTYAPPENAIIGGYTDLRSVKSISVQGAFAYISGGTSGIHVLEISRPWEIIKVGEFQKIVVGENITQDVKKDESGSVVENPVSTSLDAGKLLLVGDSLYCADGRKGLRVLNPEQVVNVRAPGAFGGTGLEQGWVEDVAILNWNDNGEKNYAYLAGGDRGLWIIDVTDKTAPEDIPYLDVAEGNNLNRLLGYANAVSVFGDYAYVSYKTRGVQIFQISDPEHPTALTPIGLDGDTQDLAIIDNRHLFVAAGSNGLQIIDVEQKVMANLVGSEDTPGNAVGITVVEDHAYIADGGSGLQIINVLDRNRPARVGSADTPGEARGVAVYKHRPSEDAAPKLYAYVADGSGGVAVYEVTNPQEPRAVTTIGTAEFAQDVALQKDRLYVSERGEGLVIYDLTDPENPVRMSSKDTPGMASRLTVDGDYAYIADYNRGLRIINIANSLDPREYGFFDFPTQVRDLVIAGNGYAYLVDGVSGMWTVSLRDFKRPIPVNFLNTPGEPSHIDLGMDGKLYIAGGSKGVYVVDITNPINPTILASFDDLKDVRAVKYKDGFAYVANGALGFPVLSMADPGNITQTGFFGTDGIALKVDIAGNYAYIVTTQGKIDIANIGFPGNLPEVKPIPPMNTVLMDTQNVLVVPQREHAYISDGVNGLVVFDISQPYKPENIFTQDTPGKLMDVAVTQHYAFLADGEGGIGLVYMPSPRDFQAQSDWYAGFDDGSSLGLDPNCDLKALNIDVIPHVIAQRNRSDPHFADIPSDFLLHYYAYVATGQCGLQTLEYTFSVGIEQGGQYLMPGEASLAMVVKGVGSAFKQTLVGIWNRRSQGPIGLFKIPTVASQIAMGQIRSLAPQVRSSIWYYIFGVFFLGVSTLYWLALVAHFILPVRDSQGSWMSFLRLIMYFRGMHGPIVTARDGVEHISPLEPHRPGVALVDLNSAIVIEEYPASGRFAKSTQKRLLEKRKESGETLYQDRAEGPGVVFLKAFERVRGVVDLRPQIRLRFKVATHTRDGIEVESMVFSLFTLGQPPETLKVTYLGKPEAVNIRVIVLHDKGVPIPGKPGKERKVQVVDALLDDLDIEDKKEIHRYIQRTKSHPNETDPFDKEIENNQSGSYLFDPHRVFDAIVSKPYDVDDQQTKEWTELPVHVAAGIFRNLVSREYYDNLYKPDDPQSFPILELKQKFMKEMLYQGVLAFQYYENLDGSPIKVNSVWDQTQFKTTPQRELRTPKLLRVRGIKVLAAGFGELKPTHEDVSQYLTRYWRSEWQREAMIKSSEFDLEALRLKNMARIQAQSDVVKTLSMILSDSGYSQEALAYRVLQALEMAATDPKTRRLLPEETIRMMERVHDLLLSDHSPSLENGQSSGETGGQQDPPEAAQPSDRQDETEAGEDFIKPTPQDPIRDREDTKPADQSNDPHPDNIGTGVNQTFQSQSDQSTDGVQNPPDETQQDRRNSKTNQTTSGSEGV